MRTAPTPATSTPTPYRGYNTTQAAAVFGVVAHTLRVGLCEKGHYLGVRPVKLPNRRLLWPADLVDAVARGDTPKAGAAAQAA
jgi:hypothetical protein